MSCANWACKMNVLVIMQMGSSNVLIHVMFSHICRDLNETCSSANDGYCQTNTGYMLAVIVLLAVVCARQEEGQG